MPGRGPGPPLALTGPASDLGWGVEGRFVSVGQRVQIALGGAQAAVAEALAHDLEVGAAGETGNQRYSGCAGCVSPGPGRVRHSSGLVNVFTGDRGGVCGPVASGVARPSDRGSR